MKTDYASMVRSILAKGATGRQIPGKPANPNVDDKLAPVQSGEYVIPTKAVDAIGKGNLDRMVMNSLGSVKVPSGSRAKGFRRGGRAGGGRGYGYIPQSSINYQEAFHEPGDNPLYDFSPGGGGRFDKVKDDQFWNEYNAKWRLRDMMDPKTSNWMLGMFSTNPWLNTNWTGGPPVAFQPPSWTPGYAQGPTQIPSFFNSQGYPYAQPVTPDNPMGSGIARHTPQRKQG